MQTGHIAGMFGPTAAEQHRASLAQVDVPALLVALLAMLHVQHALMNAGDMRSLVHMLCWTTPDACRLLAAGISDVCTAAAYALHPCHHQWA